MLAELALQEGKCSSQSRGASGHRGRSEQGLVGQEVVTTRRKDLGWSVLGALCIDLEERILGTKPRPREVHAPAYKSISQFTELSCRLEKKKRRPAGFATELLVGSRPCNCSSLDLARSFHHWLRDRTYTLLLKGKKSTIVEARSG